MDIVYSVTYIAENSLTYSFRQPVPIRYVCPPLPPDFVFEEQDAWNCNLCGSDVEFFAPYLKGDIIPFQTRFADEYNQPNSVLSAGFFDSVGSDYYIMVSLLDCCNEVIIKSIDEFCEQWWVGHSQGTGSIQTWFVNTGLFPTDLTCWRLKIEIFKKDDEGNVILDTTVYTQYYKEIPECGFTDSVLIESTYADFDCNGNYYGTLQNYLGNVNTPFFNSMRIWGEVEWIGSTESATLNDRNVVVNKTITENYKIISGVYPPYYIRKLEQTVRGSSVTVDGVVYQNFDYDQKSDESRMFAIDLTFDKKCIIDNNRCDV